jgi:glycosyltransferase involved in cell wall biosynthesis
MPARLLPIRPTGGGWTQIRDGLDGRLIDDPADQSELARAIDEMLALPEARQEWGRNGQRRVHELFLATSEIRSWGRLLGRVPLPG